MKTYGARYPGYRSAPKPANFDALSAAAAPATRDPDAFQREHGKYRDQASRAGVHPGTLLGLLDENGDVS